MAEKVDSCCVTQLLSMDTFIKGDRKSRVICMLHIGSSMSSFPPLILVDGL